MTPSIIIFDVYKTLMRVGPPSEDPQRCWERLCQEYVPGMTDLSLSEFGSRTKRAIEARHARSRAAGVDFPEILWEEILLEVIPSLKTLRPDQLDSFILKQTNTWHTTSLDEGCVPFIREARRRGIPLGIASNAQRYTHWELTRCLEPAGLSLAVFDPQLCFWSFENGFSKPSERVFSKLGSQARRLGYSAPELLMVGDRVDNDIEPALAQGWQAWHLRSPGESFRYVGGSWDALYAKLFGTSRLTQA